MGRVNLEYCRKTEFFHCNQDMFVQNRILREHPWVALELFKALQRCKEVAIQRARDTQAAYLHFPVSDFADQASIIGRDPYPVGIRAMDKNVERAVRASLEQELLTKPLALEDIYYCTTLGA